MGFYNVQQGDEPYFNQLAQQYTLLDNYHQPVKGGTGFDSIYIASADAYPFTDGSRQSGYARRPTRSKIPIRKRAPTTGGCRTAIRAVATAIAPTPGQPGVGPVLSYLIRPRRQTPNCATGAYYMLNNLNPGYVGRR